ncbi:MAG: ComEC/Rec2 family competence protein [Bdellovibrionales bacterium]|nr:ComEC/Rec2 family competence protein [Bdellovibrionales bacterium]
MFKTLHLIAIMPLMLVVIILSQIVPWSGLLIFSSDIAEYLHKFCINQMPINSPYKSLYQALVCGEPLNKSQYFASIKALGLLHLFVVSGFHLQFVYKSLEKVFKESTKFKQIFILIILLIYTFVCLLKAPVLRSYLQLLLAYKIKNEALRILIAGCVLLIFAPEYWTSLSLQLSWLIALILCQINLKESSKSLLIYFVLIILLSPLEIAHPFTMLTTYLFTPFISFFLLPFSFATAFLPKLSVITDFLWFIFIYITGFLAKELPLLEFSIQIEPPIKWLIVIFSNLIMYYSSITSKRSNLKCG